MQSNTQSSNKIQNEVQNLLTQCGYTAANLPIDVEKIAEHLGIDVRYSAYDGDLSGMLYQDEKQKVIGINALHPNNRQRFTIAHEIGHYILHDKKEVHIDGQMKIYFRGPTGEQKEENEANIFAGELLMPYNFILQDVKDGIDLESEAQITELSKKYKVSFQAMSIRLSRLASSTP